MPSSPAPPTVRRFAYDVEFVEGPDETGVPTIELISIGVVDVDSTTVAYEAISAETNITRMIERPFLRCYVAPYLPLVDDAGPIGGRLTTPGATLTNPRLDTTHPLVRLRKQIRDDIVDLLLGSLDGGQRLQLWTLRGAYDHVALHWLWGGMGGRPEPIPMFSHDVAQYADHLDVPEGQLPAHTARKHQALDDARWHAACVRHLDAVAAGRGRRQHEPGS